jgi:hypothetical protein
VLNDGGQGTLETWRPGEEYGGMCGRSSSGSIYDFYFVKSGGTRAGTFVRILQNGWRRSLAVTGRCLWVSAHSCAAGLAPRRMFFLSFLARVDLDCDFVLFLRYKLAHVGEASSCVAPALPALLLSSSPVPFLLSHFPSLLYLILRC